MKKKKAVKKKPSPLTMKKSPKKPSKKTSKAKSTSTKRTTKKFKDFHVEGQEAFYCCDGSVFYCLEDLRNALADMPNDVYAYHVTDKKNDFQSWISVVFKSKKIAEEIAKIKTPAELQNKLKRYL